MQFSLLVCKVLDYIDNNLSEEINIDLLSNYIAYDKSYMMKKFKKEVGISIFSYINVLKIFNSLSLLNNDDFLLKISLECGYNSLEYFSKIFKVVMGVSPSIYRKMIKGELTEEQNDEIREKKNKLENFFVFIRCYRGKASEKDYKRLKLSA